MFIQLIRLAVGAATISALVGAGYALYAREWVAAMFAGLGAVLFFGMTRQLRATRNVASGHDDVSNPFHLIKGRTLIALLLGGFVVGGIVAAIPPAVASSDGTDLGQALLGYGLYGFIAAGIFLVGRRADIDFSHIVGNLPERRTVIRALLAVVPLLLFSYGTIWIIYHPISLVWPEFVQGMLLDTEMIGMDFDRPSNALISVLGAVVLVILAPVVEEILFRGYLLHRWAATWGVEAAVVATTVVFASLHADPLGATLFGFAMAVFYIKTRSLGLVILCHVLNNLVAYVVGLVYTAIDGPDAVYTVVDFRQEWWVAATCLALALPWAVPFVRRNWPDAGWVVPYLSRTAEERLVDADVLEEYA
jgi:membrane protease YdiL (CAAX protease family)